MEDRSSLHCSITSGHFHISRLHLHKIIFLVKHRFPSTYTLHDNSTCTASERETIPSVNAPLVEFIYLVFTRKPGGVTGGDSGLCCSVSCLSSAIISLCLLIKNERQSCSDNSTLQRQNCLPFYPSLISRHFFARQILAATKEQTRLFGTTARFRYCIKKKRRRVLQL